ncbi:Prostaglandin E synthase 3 (Cytosolic) [Cichlidogyrus casuarinus]|uniref:Prostaglandin E synthase 3 (Cytosolic) n=1 Tax=Cichlidogyrus casuarinus TaxID=1844966 RepID=A0ABD2QFF9_9PLAT
MIRLFVSFHPEVKWGNMKKALWITIEIPDVKERELNVTEDGIKFKGTTSEGKTYAVSMDFYDKVNPSEMKEHESKRHIQLEIPKKTHELWPRAMKEKAKPQWLKSDFQHFQDEDDDSDTDMPGMGGMGGMGGMPGMGGDFGGADFSSLMSKMGNFNGNGGMPDLDGDDADGEDSDDEDLPDLEKTEKA